MATTSLKKAKGEQVKEKERVEFIDTMFYLDSLSHQPRERIWIVQKSMMYIAAIYLSTSAL